MPSVETSRENGKKGGRPSGMPTKMSRRRADELTAKGETPLDVMIDNMNFWRKRATELTDAMQVKLDEIFKLDLSDEKQRSIFVEAMQEFNKIARHMIAAREKSQSCAVDAAPYVHPKFTSISVKNQITNVKIQMAVAAAITQTVADDDAKKITNGHAAVAP